MTTQSVTFRLSDQDLKRLDTVVQNGAKDRTAALRLALVHEERRILGQRDAEIYRTQGEDPDAEAWAHNRTIPALDD
ncbi:hypothetical protein [Kineosporia sp. NBRC 101731]|uniref:hypothetical protein n=1 Tax=Kineosporia sp. NBRC 101731 TaxID=3032199 RepID=UPI0024A04E72|nr:hypothetical protein [Kineosporia sp. NBRC 101731]GLY32210.1 hypothetical protein Kisp02_55750 [Kineosporia sp. NBRC 101731]